MSRIAFFTACMMSVLCLLAKAQDGNQPVPVADGTGAAHVRQLQGLRWGMFVCWSFSTFSGKEWTPGITDLSLFPDYLGAVKHGNIFSLNVGPDYHGKLRDIDVQTLRKVGAMIAASKNQKATSPMSVGQTAEKL